MEQLKIHKASIKKGIVLMTDRAALPFIEEGKDYYILEREDTFSVLGTRIAENTNVFDKKTGMNPVGHPMDEVLEITEWNITPDGPTRTIAEFENNRLNVPKNEFDNEFAELLESVTTPQVR